MAGAATWQIVESSRSITAATVAAAMAGAFTPTEDMLALADRANQLLHALFERIKDMLRPDSDVHDPSLILELVAAVKGSGDRCTSQLRRRYLSLILEGLRERDGEPLPGPLPAWQEINERWIT